MIALTHGPHHAGSSLTTRTEGHTTLLHIRTGYVQLDGRDLLKRINASSAFCIVVRCRAAHVNDNVCIDVLHLRIDVLAEVVDTFVLQAHTVQHATGRLCHARIVIALTRMQRCSFHDDTANLIKWHKILKLQPITKRSRCCHHRILHRQLSYIYT